jgi:[ribosomal protein S5]-alanine N-acetyltransferase
MKYLLHNVESERLAYRPFEDTDKIQWMPLMHAKEILAFIALDPLQSAEQNYAVWRSKGMQRYANNTGGPNILIDKKTQQLIGSVAISIQEVDGVQEFEVGYMIQPQHWRKGYAAEAAKTCRDYAFKNNFADSLISIIDVDNIASQKVALANGMRLEKRTDFKGYDVFVYRITREEWVRL